MIDSNRYQPSFKDVTERKRKNSDSYSSESTAKLFQNESFHTLREDNPKTASISIESRVAESLNLYNAAKSGQAMCINWLLEEGYDVNLPDHFERLTPLHYAAMSGNPECIDLLVTAGADVNIKSGHSRFSDPFSYNMTPLHYAAERKHHECINILLNSGANPNAVGTAAQTPLHYVVKHKNRSESAKLLLEAGANPNLLDSRGLPPIYDAINNGDIECVKILLSFGASVTLRGKSAHQTPLHCAVERYSKKYYDMMTLLLDAPEIDIYVKDLQDRTVLHKAVTSSSDRLNLIRLLLSKGADPNKGDEEGNTPLHKLIYTFQRCSDSKECNEIIKEFIVHGVELEARNDDDETAIELAEEFENEGALRTFAQKDELLTAAKASKSAADSHMDTAETSRTRKRNREEDCLCEHIKRVKLIDKHSLSS